MDLAGPIRESRSGRLRSARLARLEVVREKGLEDPGKKAQQIRTFPVQDQTRLGPG